MYMYMMELILLYKKADVFIGDSMYFNLHMIYDIYLYNISMFSDWSAMLN